ncbi:hypothetical protein K504DRAFT_405319 [Pleomassaria siparia CBS 279.74]|uniref:Ubiquitin-like domain-containing protein n=1 Tax=Pleomassaria siparia CBS 279.74 TaxID=1314801 RepID=A0A6G1KCM2_9PLEO|nr:hypothetical protein K504DRAFT_405319 [Pleomassaria siparia CBS 279.74]
MTDTTTGVAAPPRKRGLFKKRQPEAKSESAQRDMFSHSNTFEDIVAEQAKRTRDAKEKVQAAKKRKTEEENDRKKRKVSRDGSRSASTQDSRPVGRSCSPLSPIPTRSGSNSLPARYESLTNSSSNTATLPRKDSNVIYTFDTDSEPDDTSYVKPPPRRAPDVSIPRLPSRPAPAEETEEVQDPAIAALIARARAKAAKQAEAAVPASDGRPALNTAVVQLFITSDLPDTIPLLIKIKINTQIEKPLAAWCGRQGFSKEKMESIFLTWKDKHIYTTTTIARLGVSLDKDGFISVKDDPQIYDETNLPKIHLEAWTKELFEARKKEIAEEAAAKRKAAEALEEKEPTPEPVVETSKIRLYLKSRDKPELKICVNSDTTVGHLTAAFKGKMAIPNDCPVTLMFDGERLKTLDTMLDAEIEDGDSIEVIYS